MLPDFKQFVKDNQSDIVLVIGVILIALISFGAGRLTSPQIIREPVVIEESNSLILPELSEAESNLTQTNNQNNQSAAIGGAFQSFNEISQGKFVASKNSNKYHWPWSPWARKIKPENRIWFNSEIEAQKAGYTRDSKFCELSPPDYPCQ